MTDYSKLQDHELVERFKAREEEAFNELFRRYKVKLVHVALRFTGDAQASEEIAHEVFLEIHQNMDHFQGKSRFYTYLYGIAYNKARKAAWKKRRRREDSLEADDPEGDKPVHVEPFVDVRDTARSIHDKKQLTDLLQTALQQLPETARQVFILSEIQELSYDDVAKSLGISRTNVGWHLHEARRKLRTLLPLDLLEVFYFSLWNLHEEAGFSVNLLLENTKLFLGIPSSLLLSFYMDGEANAWQQQRIEAILQKGGTFQEEYQDYRKMKTLFIQAEAPILESDFEARFERKLQGILDEENREQVREWRTLALPLLWRQRLVPVLAVLVAGITYFLGYPALLGSPASITAIQGAVKIFEPQTSTWIPLQSGFQIKAGQQIKTETGSETEITLPNQLVVRLKESSEIRVTETFRSRQKGQFTFVQQNGKAMVGLGSKFKGSRFSVETPYGQAHAYGTLFLVDVQPQQSFTRVMVLEGKVDVEDLLKQVVLPVAAQTERVLATETIGEAQPLSVDKKIEVEELKNLAVPGGIKQTGILDENLNLIMINGPGRVKEYLDNPRILTRRTYPQLTEKIAHIRALMNQADREENNELYEKVIVDLDAFSSEYLDPYAHFKPHIDFFISAIYSYLGKDNKAIIQLDRLVQFPDKQWQAIGHLAQGILYEERLKDIEKAHQSYRQALKALPGSPEADEAQNRLK